MGFDKANLPEAGRLGCNSGSGCGPDSLRVRRGSGNGGSQRAGRTKCSPSGCGRMGPAEAPTKKVDREEGEWAPQEESAGFVGAHAVLFVD